MKLLFIVIYLLILVVAVCIALNLSEITVACMAVWSRSLLLLKLIKEWGGLYSTCS